MTLFYQEKSGDYLCVDTNLKQFAYRNKGIGHKEVYLQYDGRATCFVGVPSSINTTGIAHDFLSDCKRVAKKDVPKIWLDNLIGE